MSSESELFRELLLAADRDRIPGAHPTVSIREDEDEGFAEEIREITTGRVELSRRSVWHGRWAELEEKGELAPEAEPNLRERWRNSKPIVFRGLMNERLAKISDSIELALTRGSELQNPAVLRRWVTEQLAATKPTGARFDVIPAGEGPEIRGGDERDIARVQILATVRVKGGEDERYDNLWIKVARLSDHSQDSSLRVRFSFGHEIEDDDNSDPVRNRLVAELATRCMPAASRLRDSKELKRTLEELAERPVYLTQHIAYWNTPEGGALFHHDSFHRPGAEVEGTMQMGVVFAQVSGRTAWIALSIQDLAKRVREFTDHLSDGQLAWVRAELFPNTDDFMHALDLIGNEEKLLAELASPGCGSLAQLVNRGPEFSSFLADCGHATVLRAGDVIVLPNKNFANTTMHSVFCASPDITYGVSCGIRALPGIKPLSTEVVKRGKGIQRGYRGHRGRKKN